MSDLIYRDTDDYIDTSWFFPEQWSVYFQCCILMFLIPFSPFILKSFSLFISSLLLRVYLSLDTFLTSYYVLL